MGLGALHYSSSAVLAHASPEFGSPRIPSGSAEKEGQPLSSLPCGPRWETEARFRRQNFGPPRGDAWEYNGRDPCRPTDRDAGLEHEEIFYRFLTVLGRFVACLADSATENAKPAVTKRLRVTFVENGNATPRAFASKPRNVRVSFV